MRKLKNWWNKTGIENVLLLVIALFLWFTAGLQSNVAWALIGAFIALNWQALKDLTTVDEKVEELIDKLKNDLDEKFDKLKGQIKGIGGENPPGEDDTGSP